MGHQFLTDEWMAEAKAIREKHSAPVPYKIRMNQVVTGAPFGDGEVKLFMDTSSGELVMDKGELPDPEVTLTVDYDTAKAVFVDQNQAAAMQAFMAGKIKVQGDMTKLMAMQTPPDDAAKAVAAEIQAMTA